jgi:hypothetical protein
VVNPSGPRRDGRTCDECGEPNIPSGWLDSSWSHYVEDPNSQGEGFFGLVLCAPSYVARVEEKAGPQEVLDTLMAIMRRHQRFVAGAGEAERGPDSPDCERFKLMLTPNHRGVLFGAMMAWRQQLCA